MKKFMAVLLSLVLVLGLVACGNDDVKEVENETPETNGEDIEVVGSLLDKIKEEGMVLMGTSADYPPFEFHKMIDGKDQIVGFEVDFAKEIAADMGVELEVKDMDFKAVVTSVETGLVDMALAAFNPTEERAKVVDFSDVFFNAQFTVLVRADQAGEFMTEEDLNGKIIGVQTGSIQEEMVNENIEAESVVSLGKVTDLVLQLKSNNVDAVVLEAPVAKSYDENNEDLVAVNEIDFSEFDMETGYVVVVPKGNEDLLESINNTIKRLESEGLFEELYNKNVELNEN